MTLRGFQSISGLTLLLLAWGCAATTLFSPQMRRFSAQDGLPSNRVLALAQDRQGYVWAATERGLVRYDGLHWSLPSAFAVLPEASVETLFVDSLDRIWLGLSEAGVCALAPDRRIATCFDSRAPQPRRLAGDTVFGITEFGGKIWLAVFESGLVALDVASLAIVHQQKLKHADIVSASSNQQGAYFASFSGFLTRVRGLNFSVDEFPTKHPIISIATDEDHLWLGLGDGRGVARVNFDRKPNESIDIYESSTKGVRTVLAVATDQDRVILATEIGLAVKTANSGVLIRNVSNVPNSLPEGQLTSLLVDAEDGVWIGSAGGGLAHWAAHDQALDWLPRSQSTLPTSLVNHASVDTAGALWIALHDSGVVIARAEGSFQALPIDAASGAQALPTRLTWVTRSVRKGRAQKVWVGHQMGLSSYQPSLKRFSHWAGNGAGKLVDLLEENPAGGMLMVSARQQLYALDEQMQTTRHVGGAVTGGDVEQILWRDDQLWLAGQGGLRELLPDNAGGWTVGRHPLKQMIYAFVDCANALWVADAKNLISLDRATLWPNKVVARPPGPGADIGGMRCHQDVLWFAGPGGLWRLDQGASEPIEVLRGISKVELSDRPFQIDGHSLLIGSQNGLLRVDAGAPVVTPKPFSVVLTALSSPERLPGQIELPWQNPALQLEAHGLSFAMPEQTQFKFQLEPGPAAPFTDSRIANLSSLMPGDYRLQVSARNALGIVAQAPELKITVATPPWQSWYARLALALSLLGGGVVINTLINRGKARRQAELDHARVTEQLALARTETLGYISHEMRNLLNGVTGNAELLRLANDKAQQLKLSERIVHAGESLAQLLDDALDHTKLVLNRVAINPQPFELSELLADALDSQQANARAKRLSLQQQSENTEIICEGDPGRIKQILVNLLSNAIKFTDSGEVLLKARWQSSILYVSVRDTGPGIPPTQRSEIFKPYVRLNRGAAGSGLGLAISAELARTLGGSLSLNLQIQTGSQFDLELPLPLSDATDFETTCTVTALQILVVEDQADNRALIEALLQSVGHRVTTVADGFSAIAAVSSQRFDVVLIDLDLIGMSGLDLAPILAAQAMMQGVPMVALSGRVDQLDRQACASAGMQAHIAKPYRLKKIQAVLAKVSVRNDGENQKILS